MVCFLKSAKASHLAQWNALQQKEYANLKIAAEIAEKEFYAVFKERCTELGVTTDKEDFGTHARAAVSGLNKEVKSKVEAKTFDFNTLQVKNMVQFQHALVLNMQTVEGNFSRNIFQDMVNGFADKTKRPAAEITVGAISRKLKRSKTSSQSLIRQTASRSASLISKLP